jgi:hypothetical protein
MNVCRNVGILSEWEIERTKEWWWRDNICEEFKEGEREARELLPEFRTMTNRAEPSRLSPGAVDPGSEFQSARLSAFRFVSARNHRAFRLTTRDQKE